jgi:hypothetical protein
MSERVSVSVSRCQQRLFWLWAILGLIVGVVLFIQTSPTGAYRVNASEVWDWFLAAVTPTFFLILASVIAQARSPEPESTVDRFYYRLAFGSSAVYLLLLLVLLMTYAQSVSPVHELRSMAKVVTLLYGVVGASLGVFFVSKKGN